MVFLHNDRDVAEENLSRLFYKSSQLFHSTAPSKKPHVFLSWAMSFVLLTLTGPHLHINPFSPKSDQHQISPCNTNAL